MYNILVKCRGAETINIASLVQFQGELKSLARVDYEKLKNQIIELGFVEPITVWESGDGYLIANGHQRLRTLLMMEKEGFSIPEIPISWVFPDSKEEFARIVLSLCSQYGVVERQGMYEYCSIHNIPVEYLENRLRLPEIDLPRYKAEYYVDSISSEKDNEVPEVKESICKRGDLWILGNHRLLCGDSTNEADVVRLMDGKEADMVFTDPPYNIAYDGKTKEKLKIENDEMNDESFKQFLFASYSLMNFVMKPGAPIYICHADTERVNFTHQFKLVFKLSSVIVWNKQVATFGRMDYFWKHEPILYGWKEGFAHSWYGPNNEVSVWDINRPSKSEDHPTMKPIELIERAIRNSSESGDILFEPFSGSGSTLIAADKHGRLCYGLELDPHYCDVIIARWEAYSGQKAVKIEV